jgi:hypothetical protein
MSMVSGKRAGLHPRCGTIYHWGLAVLVVSGGFLAAAHWTDDRVLCWPAWVRTHIISMGCSFIVMLTAFCVGEGNSLPGLSRLPRVTYWFLPALVGTPLIIRALARHRVKYWRAAVKT